MTVISDKPGSADKRFPNPLNIRLAVSRSVTKKQENDYAKTIATVESDLPTGLDALQALEQLDKTLAVFLSDREGSRSSEQPEPSIDASELEKLLWTPMNKNPNGAWIYSDASDAKALVAELAKADKKMLTIGAYTYRLSGEDDRFVNRWPHKGEGSTK